MKIKVLVAVAILAIFLAGLYLTFSYFGDGSKEATSNQMELVISPQDDTRGSIRIDKVRLLEKGWIVIRSIEGNRSGQIVEISSPLEPGEHKDINVPLGDFYSVGQEIIAVLYADNGDNTFNDSDKPATNPDGTRLGLYIETGEQVPSNVMSGEATTMSHTMGMPMIQVRYTDTGFEPKNLEVPVGTMVEFINESSEGMWVASNVHPAHDLLPTFDQFETNNTGETYTYVFDKAGIWPFHDHINAAREGVIQVVTQKSI